VIINASKYTDASGNKELVADIQKVQDSFETYIEHWSGYTNYVNELGQRYSVDNFTMTQSDKQAWITERFLAKDFLTSKIESYYETNLSNLTIPTKAIVNNEKANTSYTTLLNKTQSTFTIAFYQDEFSDTHYDIDTDTDKFIIDDEAAFNTKIAEYFNSTTKTIKNVTPGVTEMRYNDSICKNKQISIVNNYLKIENSLDFKTDKREVV